MIRQTSIETKVKKKKIGLILIILLFIFIVFFILLTKTEIFNIKTVQIEGNQELDSEKIFMASGIALKENIFKINLKAVRENLLLHPYIKDAKVYRKIPDKILIKIEERSAFLAISYIGSYLYIDNEGYIINMLSSKNDGIPSIEGLSIKEASIGKRLILNDDGINLSLLLKFANECKNIDLFDKIDVIDISDNRVNIYLKNRGIVAFGSLNNVEYKLSFLYEILNKLNQNNINFKLIDLDKAEDAIVVTEDN